MAKFSIVIFQEFSSGRNIEKKVIYNKISTCGTMYMFLTLNPGTFYLDFSTQLIFRFTCFYNNASNCCN